MERLRKAARLGTTSIGMDIDRGAIKAVEVSFRGGEYVLRHVGYHRLPPGTVVDGEVADEGLLAEEISEFWDAHAFGNKSVFLGIANRNVVARVLEFPPMSPEDLMGAVGYEAEEHIPMPLDESVLDHVVLGPRGEPGEGDRVLVVAAQREMVQRYTSAVRAGGLRAVGVDVKALALTRSALPGAFFGDEGAAVLLDVGPEISNLVVAEGDVPAMTRFVPVGFSNLVGAVARAADLPDDEAEKRALDPRTGLGDEGEEAAGGEEEGGWDPALAYDARRGLEEAAGELAEEVRSSIEYHHAQPRAREVSRLLLSGEGALIAGLASHLGELLGLPAENARPAEKLAANRSNISDEQLRAMEPVLAVALGLAMEEA
ncbi:MAG: type IV pilus assembly protein PilM [Rubrobacter sp.]|nr:type IV pilus assembly protein PilM [Rubrobacter sp.]MBA3952166.1 type IV pilus assembly protein PilM [Rubrobacter sp.]